MMIRSFQKAGIAISVLFFLFASGSGEGTAQEPEGVKNAAATAPGEAKPFSRNMRPVREIKFIAGNDKTWFTDDDEIFDYSLAAYNAAGKMVKRSRYFKGVDNTAFTADDRQQDYYLYEYDRDQNPVKESYYKILPEGAPQEAYSSVFEGAPGAQKNKSVRYAQGRIISYTIHEYGPNGKVAKVVEYAAPGPDGQWFTADDVIEKYHVRYYDGKGRFVKAVECVLSRQGKGADGRWFTDDDAISSVKVFSYDSRGLINKTYKYTGEGPDGAWFTDDDLMQYYTCRFYRDMNGGEKDDLDLDGQFEK